MKRWFIKYFEKLKNYFKTMSTAAAQPQHTHSSPSQESNNPYRNYTLDELMSIRNQFESEFKRTKPTELEAVLNHIKEISIEINNRKKLLKTQMNAPTGTHLSYEQMEQQLNQLRLELKKMPNAFTDEGNINANNPAAVQLQQQIMQLHNALSEIDARMGDFRRNRGNYRMN